MSLRELFNSIIDTDIATIFWIIFFGMAILFWAAYIFLFFKDMQIENKIDRLMNTLNPFRINDKDSFSMSLLKFFPDLLLRIAIICLIPIIGFCVFLAPILLLAYYLEFF